MSERGLGESKRFEPLSWVEEEINTLSKNETKEFLLKDVENPTGITIVAEDDTRIVGFVLGRINPWRVSQLRFMGVTPTYRRKGIGRSLIEEYIKESKLKGAHKVSLNTTPTLKSAIRLYIELGFVPEGFLRKHAHGMDIIVYSKFLV